MGYNTYLRFNGRHAHGRGAREIRVVPAKLVLEVRAVDARADEDREHLLDPLSCLEFDGQTILQEDVVDRRRGR